MTLDELIERLTDLRDAEGIPGHTELRIAQQPGYPLLGDLEAVTTVVESQDGEDSEATVYLASGNARDYGKRSMWDDDIQYEDDDEDEDEDY